MVEFPTNENELKALADKSRELLDNPMLFDIITNEEFNRVGIVDDYANRKALFLFYCISYVKNRGQANNLLINAQSSTGKDFVSRKVSKIFPGDKVKAFRTSSPKAFDYFQANNAEFSWDGKICRLTDVSDSVLKGDSFKTFLSDEENALVVNKTKSGTLEAQELKVKGKPVTVMTTAEANPKDEILNRVNILTLDESEEQTKAITHRRLLEASGKILPEQDYSPEILNAIYNLKPVTVEIPYAELLEIFMPTDIRARRDIPRLLNLIKASSALHQNQRQRKADETILANEQDYEIARQAIARIQTGQFVSLTRGLKKVFEALLEFEKKNSYSPTVKQLHAFKPTVCNERNYYEHLDGLAKKGLVNVLYSKPDGANKEVTCYNATSINLKSISLPPFKELAKPTIPTNGTKPAIPTKQGGLAGFVGFVDEKRDEDDKKGGLN